MEIVRYLPDYRILYPMLFLFFLLSDMGISVLAFLIGQYVLKIKTSFFKVLVATILGSAIAISGFWLVHTIVWPQGQPQSLEEAFQMAKRARALRFLLFLLAGGFGTVGAIISLVLQHRKAKNAKSV